MSRRVEKSLNSIVMDDSSLSCEAPCLTFLYFDFVPHKSI